MTSAVSLLTSGLEEALADLLFIRNTTTDCETASLAAMAATVASLYLETAKASK